MSTGPRPCLWARTVRCESPHRPRPPWAVWPYSPSYRLPQPSFRRPFSSLRCPYNAMPPSNRHPGASRNPCPQHRHSGASRNLCPPTTVIPAPAGIYAPQQPSFRRQPESMPPNNRHPGASPNRCPRQPSSRRKPESMPPSNRHPGASRNLRPPTTVIPAPAGIYAVTDGAFAGDGPLQPSFRRKPESMLAGSITVVGDYDAGFRRKPERRL